MEWFGVSNEIISGITSDMKIILFCEALRNRAGIERMTVDLANLLQSDFETLIVTINPFVMAECPYNINDNVRVCALNSSFNKSLFSPNLKNIRQFRKLILKEHPDVIITVATPLLRISAPATWGTNIKNIAWEHFNLYAGSKIGSVYKMIAPWFADQTVVLTEADAKDFKKVHAPRVIAIPNFTYIGKNEPSKCTEKILLAVGRHSRQKGFDLLLKAWAQVNAPGWKLKIVGSGELREENENLAKQLGISDNTIFVDAHSGIADEFRNASCFVLSSRFEGMVLVLLEAKMMGLPCISFDCPNSPREVIRDGIDGWLVENGNINALANILSSKLSCLDELQVAGRAARLDALNRYSPESIKQMWLPIILN